MSLQRTSSLSRLSSLQSYRSSFFQWDNSLRRSGNSQEVLEQSSLVSRVVSRIVTSQLFQPLITALIIMNSVFLALYDPTKPFNSTRNLWIEYTEIFFQAAFTIEAVLLILHLGCYGYFSITANRFDFFLVAIGYVQFIIPRVQFSAHRDPAVTAFRVLRAMRILRSLRLLKQLPGRYSPSNNVIKALRDDYPDGNYTSSRGPVDISFDSCVVCIGRFCSYRGSDVSKSF